MLIKFVSQQRPPSQSWYMRIGKGLTEGPYRTALGSPRTGRGHAGHPQRPRQGAPLDCRHAVALRASPNWHGIGWTIFDGR